MRRFPQVEGLDRERVVLGDAPDLHVVGQHDDDLVAWRQERAGRDVVRFDGTHGDQHVVAGGTVVEGGDVLTQLRRAVHVRVVQRCAQNVFERLRPIRQKLAQRNRVHTALGQVVLDGLLELRHVAFHHERLEIAHGRLPAVGVSHAQNLSHGCGVRFGLFGLVAA